MRQVYNIGKIVILLLLFPFIILACKEKENDKVIENDERKVEDIVEQEDEVQDIEEQLDLEKIYVYDNELDTEDVASVQDIPIDTNGDLYALRKPAKKEASYTMERFFMPDLAIRWTHGAISVDEFEKILDRLFYYINTRSRKEISKEQYEKIEEELYIKKLEKRMENLKEHPKYEILAEYINKRNKL